MWPFLFSINKEEIMKHYHSLRKTMDFQLVYRTGRSKANKYLVFYYKKNSFGYNRLGISVSKKVGNSVVRHRVTRLIRESYRLNQEKLKNGYDIVIVARNTAKDIDYHKMESAFMHLAGLHHLKRVDEVEKDIGHGAQGCCYVVFSEQYKMKFVAKCMQSKEGNEQLVNRQFKREVYSLTHITHPNIVKIYDYFAEGKYIFMIIEYCENGNLMNLVMPHNIPSSKHKAQYYNQIRKYFRDVLSALVYCHNERHISHHDIKPHNIVIDSYNHAKLCDFGLSQKIKEHISNIDDEDVNQESQDMIDVYARSEAQNIGGSPFFMSPQILKCYFHPHEHFDMFAADIWAFGVTAYILICFRYPFVGRNKREVYDLQKALIDEAHRNGIAVIMDIVHSHAVKNEVEGLGNLAGDPNQYFYPGDRHEHPAWDSLCFDYGKDDVIHFLLSNCKYWMKEFHFDGFRFDGVTSMLYYSHGLGEAFCNYGDYFNGHEDDNAICYLTLANKLIHEVNPDAITIAEEVSGMPGLAAKFEDGGFGFDYRMAMNIPDYWIKTIKEKSDEDWKPSSIFWEVKNRRPDEKTISYCESHDQALVGDKTIIFRLIDADMYWHFKKGDENETVHRGIALHKMIRLVTAGAINGGYLNFMGNEFGHPEWIDFPREGNGWSYKYARRQWNLVDNHDLCYHYLGDFDKAMLKVIKSVRNFQNTPVQEIWHNDGDQVLAFMRGDLVFVFNFSPTRSFTDYGFLVPTGSYDVVLNTDSKDFGGNGFADDTMTHVTNYDPLYVKDHKEWLKLYIPARSAVVLKKN